MAEERHAEDGQRVQRATPGGRRRLRPHQYPQVCGVVVGGGRGHERIALSEGLVRDAAGERGHRHNTEHAGEAQRVQRAQ
eukprot:scaffold64635_cov66-Phaeocystis_antarctica.AAC.5